MINKIFNLFKAKCPKDNFDFIAMNIVAIHIVLQEKYNNYFAKEDDLITASGVIYAIAYISEKSISLDKLKTAILFAHRGNVSLDLIQIAHEKENMASFFVGSKNLFLNFILQIESLIMYVDNPTFGAKEIMYAVINKKKDIKKMMNITKEKINNGKFSKFYKDIEKVVNTFMTSDKFEPAREQLEFTRTPI